MPSQQPHRTLCKLGPSVWGRAREQRNPKGSRTASLAQQRGPSAGGPGLPQGLTAMQTRVAIEDRCQERAGGALCNTRLWKHRGVLTKVRETLTILQKSSSFQLL